MYFGLRKAVERVNSDPALRALVLTGVDDVFAPGGEMGGRHDDDTAGVGELLGTGVLPFHALRHSAAPVVAAVNGICQGGGLMLAMLADVAVASERASFRAPELLRGVADAWFAAVLPEQVGIARARELMFTGRRIDAAEALRIGLVARVVPHDQLQDAARQLVREILQTAPTARAQWKRMVNARYGWVDEPGFEASLRGDECLEGFRAFVEKRPPSWVPEED